MADVLGALGHAVDGAPLIALAAALAWGILSILLSPCHLSSIPLIVGFISDQRDMTTRRAFWTATSFAVGILSTIALIGVVTASLGRIAGDLGGYANYAVALVFFAVGLHLLDAIRLPFAGKGSVDTPRRGLRAAFLLGLLFGIALGPCTFAFMAPVLAATFRVAAAAPVLAFGLLVAYGVGHCGVIVGAGTSAEMVQRYLNWNSGSRSVEAVKKLCGVLVILGGLWLLYTAH